MVAPRDTLPTRNEEYGTKQYWCVLTCLFCLLSQIFDLISGIRDTHSESSKEVQNLIPGLRPGRREAQVTFDWFKSYEDVADLLRPLLPDKTARILVLGC